MFKNLKELRIENNLLQKNIANILNISRNTYEKYEVGEKTITINHLNKLSNYYNVCLDYIVGASNKKNSYNFKKVNTLNISKISKNIKYIRIYFNLTQEQFAKSINVSKTTISAIENEKRMLNILIAISISRRYKISIDWIYGRSESMFIQN